MPRRLSYSGRLVTKTQRLFFALWPHDAVRAAIGTLARDVAVETGGRAVALGNAHLTLAFLGEQPARFAVEIDMRSTAAIPAFHLSFDKLGCWRKTGIAWLGTTTAPAELSSLEQKIARALAPFGLEADDRPFSPHVTLARRIVRVLSPRAIAPIVWSIDSFALMESAAAGAGREYRVVRSWPLAKETPLPLRQGQG